MKMQKITPFLWFDNQAGEAARFYTSIFPNSVVRNTSYYSDAGPNPKSSVMTVSFELDGLLLVALNGGPAYKFTEAISFVVNCDSQEEIDRYWEKLSEGGKEIQCGWLTDKFGVTWQIVPVRMIEMMQDKDPEKARRVVQAMFPMKKLDLAVLEKAYRGD